MALHRLVLALCLIAVPAGAQARVAGLGFDVGDGTELPGFRFGDPSGPLGAKSERLAKAIYAEFGLDVRPIPTHILNEQNLTRIYRRWGGSIGVNWTLDGVAFKGHIFVKPGIFNVDTAVLVHETLHVLSRRFSDEAGGAGCNNLVEGIDQYFTRELLAHQLSQRNKNRVYVGYTEFAEALAAVVGYDRLREAFFKSGFAPLGRAFDGRFGSGALDRACRALEGRNIPAAFAVIGL